MMLCTSAFVPAICLAIEPQKFSAATTLIPVVLALETPPQPERTSAAASATRRATTVARERAMADRIANVT